jgi:hypothetical protein
LSLSSCICRFQRPIRRCALRSRAGSFRPPRGHCGSWRQLGVLEAIARLNLGRRKDFLGQMFRFVLIGTVLEGQARAGLGKRCLP